MADVMAAKLARGTLPPVAVLFTLEAREAADECIVCYDQPGTHMRVPCGHQCVHARRVRPAVDGDAAEHLPVCRGAVTMAVQVIK